MSIKDYLHQPLRNLVAICISVFGCICALVALSIYLTHGLNEFILALDAPVIALLIVGMIVNLAAIGLTFLPQFKIFVKIVQYLVFLLIFSAWIQYLNTEAAYLANVFVGIDPTGLKPEILNPFVATVVFMTLSMIVSLVSAIMYNDGIGAKAAMEGGTK